MFKKSEEQEWSRFRGALAKDRDETATTEEPDAATAAQTPATSAGQAGPGPSFRPSSGDVNVGLPSSSRLARGSGDHQEVESLIGERTSFEGTFRSEGSVRVMGSVQGELQCKGTIIVEEKARVTARLTGAQVTVAGLVDGQIYCEGRVEIRPTGRVTGEISAGALIVQEGAYFDGNSKMATPGSGGPPPAPGEGTSSSTSSGSSAAPSRA